MTPIESVINFSMMSNVEGVQYIYDLDNSEVSQEEKISVLKSHITEYIFNVLEYGAYHLEDEIYEDIDDTYVKVVKKYALQQSTFLLYYHAY